MKNAIRETAMTMTPTNARIRGAPNMPRKKRRQPTSTNSIPTRPASFDIPVEFSIKKRYQNSGLDAKAGLGEMRNVITGRSLIPAASAKESLAPLAGRGFGGGGKSLGEHLLLVGEFGPRPQPAGDASGAHFFAGTVHLVQF